MATIEKRLETNFVAWCQAQEIIAIKGPVATSKGFPDRFVQLPHNGGTIYVEFKGTSSYGLSPLQQWWKDYIKASSPHRYFLVDTDEDPTRLKERCQLFMSIGSKLTEYEQQLLVSAK